jgi:hypothetical protein
MGGASGSLRFLRALLKKNVKSLGGMENNS